MALQPLPIAWAEVDAYADRIGCGEEDRMTLHEVMAALDAEWLRQVAAKQAARG